MNVRSSRIRCAGCVCALLLISACREPSAPSPAGEQIGSPEWPAETPRVRETGADAPGKPTPPIGIRYEVLGEPRVGQPLEIRITSRSQIALSGLGMRVQGDERLSVSPASSHFRVAQMAVDEPLIRTVTVTPLAEGLLHLDVLLQGEIDGRMQANQVRIPIRVGSGQRTPEVPGTLKSDEAGEAIISMPAQEN
jgi:hypothetical protein